MKEIHGKSMLVGVSARFELGAREGSSYRDLTVLPAAYYLRLWLHSFLTKRSISLQNRPTARLECKIYIFSHTRYFYFVLLLSYNFEFLVVDGVPTSVSRYSIWKLPKSECCSQNKVFWVLLIKNNTRHWIEHAHREPHPPPPICFWKYCRKISQ